jgi:hypothetical protein
MIKGSYKDLTGEKFAHLTVLKHAGHNKRGAALWECICDCPRRRKIIVIGSNLSSENTTSCGCESRKNRRIHGDCSGDKTTAEYRIWLNMKTRCYCPNRPCYPDYGGRGITVCPRWRESFELFLADMGRRPSKRHTLDRRNNDGNYEPENCRWATRKQQARNQRFRTKGLKLCRSEVEIIRAGGYDDAHLAARFKVTTRTVRHIRTGKTWKYVKAEQ